MENKLEKNTAISINLSYIYDIRKALTPFVTLKSKKQNLVYQNCLDSCSFFCGLLHKDNIYKIRSSYSDVIKLVDILQLLIEIPAAKENEYIEITIETSNSLLTSAKKIDDSLRNEIATRPAYLVSPRGGYNAENLLYEPKTIFPTNLFTKVPRVQQEAKECARALAFESAPAAGIFLMRIFETVVDKYYSSKPELKNVDTLHRKIEQLSKSLPEEKKYLTNLLMLLKDDRNDITHPSNRVESITELLELFDMTKPVIALILKELSYNTASETSKDTTIS
jgi:hypothetical protein